MPPANHAATTQAVATVISIICHSGLIEGQTVAYPRSYPCPLPTRPPEEAFAQPTVREWGTTLGSGSLGDVRQHLFTISIVRLVAITAGRRSSHSNSIHILIACPSRQLIN
jgi:hypothetical protein